MKLVFLLVVLSTSITITTQKENFMMGYIKQLLLKLFQRSSLEVASSLPRPSTPKPVEDRRVPPVVLIGAQGGNTLEIYDLENPKNNKILNTKLAEVRFGHVTGVFDDGIVAIAGGNSNNRYRADTILYKLYNPNFDLIKPGPSMDVSRAYAASAMVDNEMIVCGGFDGKKSLATCQKLVYDQSIAKHEWKPFKSLNKVRYSHAMVEVSGNPFVIGGFRDNVVTNNIEKYDKATDAWTDVAPMSTIRFQSAAAKMGGFIYVCGGAPPSTGLKTCEKYDTDSGNWSPVADMNTATVAFNMLPIKGKLYAFTGHASKTVESYDPETDTWTITKPMKMVRSFSKAVQLKLA